MSYSVNGIPVIDFQSFHSTNKEDIADEIVQAFKSSGCLYLTNHGVPLEQVRFFGFVNDDCSPLADVCACPLWKRAFSRPLNLALVKKP